MKTRFLIPASLSLIAFAAHSQQPRELLLPVEAGQAQRVEEYNSTYLLRATYYASRYRIVRADLNAVLAETDITITPFDDVDPIRLEFLELQRNGEDILFWKGRYSRSWSPSEVLLGFAGRTATVVMMALDVDEDGSAVISAYNRFEFSPKWAIDENGVPFLEDSDSFGIANTPPPRTPEEIARHRRLKRLTKHAFFAARATLDVPGRGSRYVLDPLKFLPRYSVMYEIPGDTKLPPIDRIPGEPISAEDRAREEGIRAFLDSLPPDETGKQVLGDIP
jgi:hypothetical protein